MIDQTSLDFLVREGIITRVNSDTTSQFVNIAFGCHVTLSSCPPDSNIVSDYVYDAWIIALLCHFNSELKWAADNNPDKVEWINESISQVHKIAYTNNRDTVKKLLDITNASNFHSTISAAFLTNSQQSDPVAFQERFDDAVRPVLKNNVSSEIKISQNKCPWNNQCAVMINNEPLVNEFTPVLQQISDLTPSPDMHAILEFISEHGHPVKVSFASQLKQLLEIGTYALTVNARQKIPQKPYVNMYSCSLADFFRTNADIFQYQIVNIFAKAVGSNTKPLVEILI